MGLHIPPSVSALAIKAGVELVCVADRVEVRQGKKVICFNSDPALAMKKALERIEEKRLRELDPRPQDREPVLHIPVRRTRAPVVLVAPPMPDPPPLPAPAPDYTDSQIGQAVAKVIKQSIIKSKYKDRYKPNGGTCGDLIADELTQYTVVLINGKARVDLKRLEEVARANECWRDSYEALNVGQRRMTIGNRLRARYAEGAKVDIGGVIIIDPECIE